MKVTDMVVEEYRKHGSAKGKQDAEKNLWALSMLWKSGTEGY